MPSCVGGEPTAASGQLGHQVVSSQSDDEEAKITDDDDQAKVDHLVNPRVDMWADAVSSSATDADESNTGVAFAARRSPPPPPPLADLPNCRTALLGTSDGVRFGDSSAIGGKLGKGKRKGGRGKGKGKALPIQDQLEPSEIDAKLLARVAHALSMELYDEPGNPPSWVAAMDILEVIGSAADDGDAARAMEALASLRSDRSSRFIALYLQAEGHGESLLILYQFHGFSKAFLAALAAVENTASDVAATYCVESSVRCRAKDPASSWAGLYGSVV